jgi:hypothetical protein
MTHPYITQLLAAERIRDMHEVARQWALVAAAQAVPRPRARRTLSRQQRLRLALTAVRAVISARTRVDPHARPDP